MNGPELKALRQRLGLSRAQAARRGQVSERSWSRFEAGGKPIPAAVLELFRAAGQPAPVGHAICRSRSA